MVEGGHIPRPDRLRGGGTPSATTTCRSPSKHTPHLVTRKGVARIGERQGEKHLSGVGTGGEQKKRGHPSQAHPL